MRKRKRKKIRKKKKKEKERKEKEEKEEKKKWIREDQGKLVFDRQFYNADFFRGGCELYNDDLFRLKHVVGYQWAYYHKKKKKKKKKERERKRKEKRKGKEKEKRKRKQTSKINLFCQIFNLQFFFWLKLPRPGCIITFQRFSLDN